MYVGPDGFHHSEMLSPSLLIAKPGCTVSCYPDGSSDVTAKTILHSACLWSRATVSSLIIIYFDPLSDTARIIQSVTLGVGLRTLDLIPNELLENHYLSLESGEVTPESVLSLIDDLKATVSRLRVLSTLDARILAVAAALTNKPMGRLNLNWLSALVKLSAVRLRQLFKAQIGMTLSKYKAWQQLHGMFRCLALKEERYFDWGSREATQNAGFYDDAHGYRTMSQYFGPRDSLTTADLRLINCIVRKKELSP